MHSTSPQLVEGQQGLARPHTPCSESCTSFPTGEMSATCSTPHHGRREAYSGGVSREVGLVMRKGSGSQEVG